MIRSRAVTAELALLGGKNCDDLELNICGAIESKISRRFLKLIRAFRGNMQ